MERTRIVEHSPETLLYAHRNMAWVKNVGIVPDVDCWSSAVLLKVLIASQTPKQISPNLIMQSAF